MCMNDPKVSILMAVYRPTEKLIKEAFDSIENQLFTDFEVVIVNDGGDKNALISYLADYSFSYRMVDNDVNMGLTKSLNKGLKYCNGEYIARFDDDDKMTPNRILKQLKILENNHQYGFVTCNFDIIDIDGNLIGSSKLENKDDIFATLVHKGNCMCHSALFIRKSVLDEIGGYDERLLYAQDYNLYMRLISKYDFYCVYDKLVLFRRANTRNPIEKSLLSAVYSFYSICVFLNTAKVKNATLVFVKRSLILMKIMYNAVFRGRW